jgi:CubicO group peptidase (beta-lactamase class C family)
VTVSLAETIDAVAAETHFSGVVCVDRDGETELARAYGLAHRGHAIPNTTGTQFGIASGTKGLTALTVISLIERGDLSLDTTARSVLGADLPLVSDSVTVGHLLAHRSGIGDFLDEDVDYDPGDYTLTVPAQDLSGTEQYLAVLGGHPAKFVPGQRFSYCNGGYVILALLAERTAGVPFQDLVRDRVCGPAGMTDTAFLRSDELPGRAATGYLVADGPGGSGQTNVFHLPVLGSGDGGIYTTVADFSALWRALFAGQIVAPGWVAGMVRPHSDVPSESMRYGLGFWLHQTGPAVLLVGSDAGVSFRSVHDPTTHLTHTVISNTTDGAWPLTRRLGELLGV